MYLKEAENFIRKYPNELERFSGCSIDEIEHLSNYLNLKLPEAFREYLKWFGRSGGSTLSGSHFGYRYISDEYFNEMIEEEIIKPGVNMKSWAEDLLTNTGFKADKYLKNTIVFMYHPEGTFHYIKADINENPPVYEYSRHESFSKTGPKILSITFGNYILRILKNNIEGQKILG